MTTRNEIAIAEVFNKYDVAKAGQITKQQLKECLYDLSGRKLDDTEVGHICELMDADRAGNVTLTNFTKVVEQFFRFC
jgi:Ca2+-binding EF-hand superfamily protein